LLKATDLVQRPQMISAANHLVLGMDDITAPLAGYIEPAHEHVASLLSFVRGWERAAPLVIHCYAGISRSTAGAFVTACALNPSSDERAIAQRLRLASRTATPNIRIVSLGDRALGRAGRMVEAIEAIGQGEMAAEGDPFRLDLE